MSYWEKRELNYQPQGLGQMTHAGLDFVMLDDFLDDPMAARQQILDLDFQAPPNPEVGVISFNGPIPDSLVEELDQKLSAHFGTPVEFHPRSKCALTFANVPKRNICHVDGGNNMCMFNWTVVVYLNTPEQCQGGTNMYRHIPTGDLHNKRGHGFYAADYRDPKKWELVGQAEMEFNRVLLCPAWRFHGLDFTFGDSKETARMTLNPKVIVMP